MIAAFVDISWSYVNASVWSQSGSQSVSSEAIRKASSELYVVLQRRRERVTSLLLEALHRAQSHSLARLARKQQATAKSPRNLWRRLSANVRPGMASRLLVQQRTLPPT